MLMSLKDFPKKPLSCECLVFFAHHHKIYADVPIELRQQVAIFTKPHLDRDIKKNLWVPEWHKDIRYLAIGFLHHDKQVDHAEAARMCAGRILNAAKTLKIKTLSLIVNHKTLFSILGDVMDGFSLANYRFDKYKSDNTRLECRLELIVSKTFRSRVKALRQNKENLHASVRRCRDLINEPADRATPEVFASLAQRIARTHHLSCEILDEKQLKKKGYPALLAVGKGSCHPPRLITLKYQRRHHKRHMIFVGKGVTFDTGGISIKPAKDMWEMKGDMSGAAAVLYAMEAIAALKPSVNVTGIIATAENAIGSAAQLPGTIFHAKNGKSIHVDNTDAEGRLILTDAFARCDEEEKVDHIVDIATLTGSCVRALGPDIAGVMGNHPRLIKALINAGHAHGETFWELPLHAPYRKLLDCPIADINNIGGPNAGAITAGLFLQEFIPKGARWAHCDIAGTFLKPKADKYYAPGATGFAVRTLVELACHWNKYLK